MKKTTNPKGTRILVRALVLCLCAALLAGGAWAEGITDIGEGIFTELKYQTTLADGRVLLAGFGEPAGGDMVPELLCLNGDRTVSWRYTDKVHIRSRYIAAAELADGTIGAVIWPDRDENMILQFFAPDGQPTGKELRAAVSADAYICRATASRLLFTDEESDYSYLLDWDGNRITQLPLPVMSAEASGVIGDAESLVLFGVRDGNEESWHNPGAVIMKKNLQGKTIWETKPECVWDDTAGSAYLYAVRMDDGGFLAMQSEYLGSDEGVPGYRNALVKLNASGETEWVCTDGLEFERRLCKGLTRCNGKIAAQFDSCEHDAESYILDRPLEFFWFDEDGKCLGNTVLRLTEADLAQLGEYTPEQVGGYVRIDARYEEKMVPMEDGLWALSPLLVTTGSSEGILDQVIVKVPEP